MAALIGIRVVAKDPATSPQNLLHAATVASTNRWQQKVRLICTPGTNRPAYWTSGPASRASLNTGYRRARTSMWS